MPLGAVAFTIALRLIPALPVRRPARLDWPGIVLTGLALGDLTYTASLLAEKAPPWTAVAAVPFLLPLLFETVFGWSAIKSGVIVMFVFVGNIGIKPATAYLI
ncbi:MAG TPA: hypothetical protein VHZ03_02460, partial [Trebonia sp.]|nr:hypothetical protein [Trebonia sp.]